MGRSARPPAAEKLAMLEAQLHRRIVKTHLPVDALVFSPKAKYIYIARDGRDVLFSWYHHHCTANALWYQIMNDTPGLVGPPIGPPDPDVRRYFRTWLEQDGYPAWSFRKTLPVGGPSAIYQTSSCCTSTRSKPICLVRCGRLRTS